MVPLFSLLGPLVGALAMCTCILVLLLTEAFTAEQVPLLTAAAMPMVVIFGYFVGLLPALACGLAFSFAPASLRRVWLAPVFGAVAVLIVWWLTRAMGHSFGTTALALMLPMGALAAFCCALVSRRANWF